MKTTFIRSFLCLCLCCVVSACIAAEALPETDLDLYLRMFKPQMARKVSVPPLELKDNPAFKPVKMQDLPDIQQDIETRFSKTGKLHSCGLLCTVNHDQYDERKVEGERRMLLPRALTGFLEDIEVRAYWQPGKAPLAVTFLGFGQAADDKNARAWQADLYRAGNHVLSFDSLIRNNMNRATGHGVAGNFIEEGKRAARIITAFLQARDGATGETFRGRISCVRILGASYGANIALQAMRDPGVKDWPLDRVLLLSVPVDFLTTSQLFDRFYREDRSRFRKAALARLLNGFTPDNDEPTPKELSLMRAGVGYSFYGDFISIVKDNMERYMPGLKDELRNFNDSAEFENHRKNQLEMLKSGYESEKRSLQELKRQIGDDQYDKLKDDLESRYDNQKEYVKKKFDDLDDWSFKHYIFLLCRPYWELKANYSDFGRLRELMNGAPNYVQVVIAEDDPLNTAEDLALVKQALTKDQLLLIPHGGHLGYNGTRWFQALMAKFFAN